MILFVVMLGSLLRRVKKLGKFQKILLTFLFLVSAINLFANYYHTSYGVLIFLGIVISVFGDFILMNSKNSNKRFDLGATFFLIAQIAYITNLLILAKVNEISIEIILGIVVLLAMIFYIIIKKINIVSTLCMVKALYVSLLIGCIILSAVLFYTNKIYLGFLLASLLFFFSDLLLILNRIFKLDTACLDLNIWASYALAQILYIFSPFFMNING